MASRPSLHPHELSPKRQFVWLLSMSGGSMTMTLLVRWLPSSAMKAFTAPWDILDEYSLAFFVGQWFVAFLIYHLILGDWFAESRWRGTYDYGRTETMGGAFATLFNIICIVRFLDPAHCLPPHAPLAPLLIFVGTLLPGSALVLHAWYRRLRGRDAHNISPYRRGGQMVVVFGLIFVGCWQFIQHRYPPCSIPPASYLSTSFVIAFLALFWVHFTSPSSSLYNPRWVITTSLAMAASFGAWLLLAWTAPARESWPLWAITGMLSGTLYASVVLVLWNWALESPEKYRRTD